MREQSRVETREVTFEDTWLGGQGFCFPQIDGFIALTSSAALQDSVARSGFFFSPSDVAEKKAPQGRPFRIGGLVEEGSVKKQGQEVRFVVTDMAKTVPVVYRGLLPDLFRLREAL